MILAPFIVVLHGHFVLAVALGFLNRRAGQAPSRPQAKLVTAGNGTIKDNMKTKTLHMTKAAERLNSLGYSEDYPMIFPNGKDILFMIDSPNFYEEVSTKIYRLWHNDGDTYVKDEEGKKVLLCGYYTEYDNAEQYILDSPNEEDLLRIIEETHKQSNYDKK